MDKIKNIFQNIINLWNNVMKEAIHHVNWTSFYKLWIYIKQFTIVAVISIIALFIMDNMIVYALRWIFI